MTAYPHLLAPLELPGGVVLPNRVLMGSMHVGLEEDFRYHRMAAYFAARARGGVGLIVTGGIAPDWAGMAKPFAAKLSNRLEVRRHRTLTDAVHSEGGRIAMQILHTGRYAYQPLAVAPSRLKSPISWFTPRALSGRGVTRTIDHFVRCAVLAREAGYDGVEVMGSEGYLINQFIAPRTNKRTDGWGGSFDNRTRFPIEIVRRIREATGEDFIIVYRLSMLDLVEDGSTWDEVVALGKAIEGAGASILNTGIGWHEARVPTIATMVPRGAFTWITRRLREHVGIPVVTSNRINTPEVAEDILARGDADLVSLARPMLADPDFVAKAKAGHPERINTCIACNQACLDHVFKNQRASCLVNPLACHESERELTLAETPRTVAVVGAGPGGLSAAMYAAQRGHRVTLFEAGEHIGGQFRIARRIPGKDEFDETLRFFDVQLDLAGVERRLSTLAGLQELLEFDHVILATGVKPRTPPIPGIDHPKVLSYLDVLAGGVEVGARVAIIGAGGIGFDVAEFLTHTGGHEPDLDAFLDEWGIDRTHQARGGLKEPAPSASARHVFLCQRSEGKLGAKLGKTTGWIHRAQLQKRGVERLAGCTYERIDDDGLHITIDGASRVLDVDHVVICAGQVVNNPLAAPLQEKGKAVTVIGGALEAGELDAKRAIAQGLEAALAL